MGSGKSHTGKILAEKLGIPFSDLDQEIIAGQHKSIPELFEIYGEERFREIEQKTLHQTVIFKDIVVSCGGGTPCYFNNMEWMNGHGITIYLHTSESLLFERLQKESSGRPLLANANSGELKNHIHGLLEKRLAYYQQAQVVYHQHQNDEDVAGFLHQCIQNKQITSTIE